MILPTCCSYFILPLEDVIQQLFCNPEFAKHVDDPPAALLSSPYIQWLDAFLGGAISDPKGNPNGARVVLFAIAGDGVSFFDNSKITTGVLALKCLGLPPEMVSTMLASYTLGFFGGKHEPSIVADALTVVVDAFLKHMPFSGGCGTFLDASHTPVAHMTDQPW